jgi:hypothetical protein
VQNLPEARQKVQSRLDLATGLVDPDSLNSRLQP